MCSSRWHESVASLSSHAPFLNTKNAYSGCNCLQAEVTGGGIPLSEVNCSTMESRRLDGVYLCGEICDVFGRIGGFNFYWAWLSGRLAGLSVAKQHVTQHPGA